MSAPPDLSGSSDGDLRDRAREGSEAAYAELVRRHLGPVYDLIYQMVGDPQRAKQLAEETFFKAVHGDESNPPEPH